MKAWLSMALLLGLLVPAAQADEVMALPPLVVTASRVATPLDRTTTPVTVITAADIAASGAQSLPEVLADVPGLFVVSNGPLGSVASASLRGASASQVLVLLDGVRLNSAQNGQFDLANLPVPLAEIERIEVVRGASSSLYGSNALAGVIQIFTRHPGNRPESRVAVGAGRFGTRQASAGTGWDHGSWRYRIAAAHDESDGFRPNSALDRNRLDGTLGLTLPGDLDLELKASWLDKDSGVPGSTVYPSPYAEQTDHNLYTQLALTAPVGAGEALLRLSHDRQHNIYDNADPLYPDHGDHLLKTSGAEAQLSLPLDPLTLVVGADAYRESIDSTIAGNHDRNHWAGFALAELAATPTVTLQGALRYDGYDGFADQLSPRLGVQWRPLAGTRLGLSAGEAYRAPTLNDLYWFQDFGYGSVFSGNPDLKPETARELELTLGQELGAFGSLTVTGFRRDVDDLIAWQAVDPADPWGAWSVYNVSRARIWGVETTWTVRPTARLRLDLNHTYLHPKDLDSGDWIVGKPQQQAGAALQYRALDCLRLRLDGRWLHFYPEVGRTTRNAIVFDANATWTLPAWRRLQPELQLGVKNLLDANYQLAVGYPMPPRQWFMQLAARF